jgi:hypothetical protein
MSAQQTERIREVLNSTSILWIGLVVALLLLAVVVHRIRAWYRDDADPADWEDEIIGQMEELNRRGDLSDEEFRSIKGRFPGRMDQGDLLTAPEDGQAPSN